MSIKYYLIHCDEHAERMPHINKIKENFNQEINIFKGVYTNKVSLNDQREFITQYNPKIQFSHFRYWLPGQIGCYLSHLSLMEHIMNNPESDYSVIFEDDVVFDTNTLHSNIENIIKNINIDFDILYLGNNNQNKGKHIINDIYHVNVNEGCCGTQALLINNKNIKKIVDVNYTIRHALDIQYVFYNQHRQLINLVINPILCWHGNLKSNIELN
jgi:GR25 family glycosyltransferase involved in LPS biosynthesis